MCVTALACVSAGCHQDLCDLVWWSSDLMGEQLQSLGLVPTLCAITPHGSYFPFYFCTLMGSPNIIVSSKSGDCEKGLGGANISKYNRKKNIYSEDRLSRTMVCNSPADRKTLVDLLHQTGTTMWQPPLFQDPHILQEKQSETYVYTRCCLMSGKKKDYYNSIDGVQSQKGNWFLYSSRWKIFNIPSRKPLHRNCSHCCWWSVWRVLCVVLGVRLMALDGKCIMFLNV